MRRYRPFRVLLAGSAALGAAVALTACSPAREAADAACTDVVNSEAGYSREIVALGKAIEEGTSTDHGTLTQLERAWADLVLGDAQCFSAEKVVVARTLQQAAAR